QVAAASPNRRATVFLIKPGLAIPVSMHGGVPSLEKAVGDPEVSRRDDWRDAPADRAWTLPPSGDILRAMDRFHRMPHIRSYDSPASFGGQAGPQPPATSNQQPAFARRDSSPASAGMPAISGWAEWLYFNGRSVDGRLRFYLSFIAGAPNSSGMRPITA